jgi:TRAP-type C4-dicarboxylate transport system permease small subunit
VTTSGAWERIHALRTLEKISEFLNQFLIWLAGCFLGAMIVMTCANIFLRIVWVPIRGTYELMGYFGAVATAFAIGYTQIKRGHIAVDIMVTRFSAKTRRILDGVNNLLCMAFFAVVAYKIVGYGSTLWRTGEVTETLRIIYYPFVYCVAIGCLTLSLVFGVDFLKALLGAGKEGQG